MKYTLNCSLDQLNRAQLVLISSDRLTKPLPAESEDLRIDSISSSDDSVVIEASKQLDKKVDYSRITLTPADESEALLDVELDYVESIHTDTLKILLTINLNRIKIEINDELFTQEQLPTSPALNRSEVSGDLINEGRLLTTYELQTKDSYFSIPLAMMKMKTSSMIAYSDFIIHVGTNEYYVNSSVNGRFNGYLVVLDGRLLRVKSDLSAVLGSLGNSIKSFITNNLRSSPDQVVILRDSKSQMTKIVTPRLTATLLPTQSTPRIEPTKKFINGLASEHHEGFTRLYGHIYHLVSDYLVLYENQD